MEILKTLFLLTSVLTLTQCYKVNPPEYRLSGDVVPTFYSLKIRPNLDKKTFQGEVTIQIRVLRAVNSVDFHSRGLHFDSVFFDLERVEDLNGRCCAMRYVYGYEFESLDLVKIRRSTCKDENQKIGPGAHSVFIKYNGKIRNNEDDQGFFKETQMNRSFIYVTDLEPSSARKVFPCFDEPRFKAVFQLNIFTPNDSYVAVSNTRSKVKVPTPEGILYKFEATPLMSTYLICFAITDNNYTEYVNSKNIRYRLYANPVDKENNTRLLRYADEVMEYLSNYTTFKSPLTKIDLIAFDTAEEEAMENWGLITFDSPLLTSNHKLYNESYNKMVLAHELTHFWFGNLVTNDWWNDIWLHESLTTYISTKTEEALLKNSVWDRFPDDAMEMALATDANASKPVLDYQETPTSIIDNFNEITYDKGAAILRMIEFVLGEEKFQKAIIDYVGTFAYKTASTDDFLSIIARHCDDVNIREFMETFLYQAGFPIVSVKESDEAYVLQQRGWPENITSFFGQKWTIPITYITSLNNTPTWIWFHKDANSISIPKNNSTWIRLNVNRIIYHRINYSHDLWMKAIRNLQTIELKEWKHLIVEATFAFESNLTSCDVLLQLLWEISKNQTLELEYGYKRTHQKLTNILDEVSDNKTLTHLNSFYSCVLKRAGFTANKIMELIDSTIVSDCDYNFVNSNLQPEEKRKTPEQLKYCFKRLQTPQNLNISVP